MFFDLLESRICLSPMPLPWTVRPQVMHHGRHAHVLSAPAKPGRSTAAVGVAASAGVVSRLIYYADSAWDASKGATTTADFNAIATDKIALLPGQTATYNSISNYSRGINGVFVDFAGGTVAAGIGPQDFGVAAGNSSSPATWAAGPAASVTVFPLSGSTRIAISWPNDTITGKWLEITVKATAATGLTSPDVFYFGSCPGDTTGDGQVAATDVTAVRSHPRTFLNPALVTDQYDCNKDGRCNSQDEILVRINLGASLQMITVPSAGPTPPAGYSKLSFSDDFNGTTLSSTWTPQMWWGRNIGEGDEVNTPANATVSGGTLNLKADKVGSGYTGVLVQTGGLPGNTANAFSFLYGYAEASIKVPKGQGLWPAFWFMPASFNDGQGEIDAMEMLGDDTTTVYGTLHHGGSQQKTFHGTTDLSLTYHTYAVEWQPDHVSFFLDGISFGTITNTALIPTVAEYAIFDLAVGGSWAGPPDANTKFPSTLQCDYVRVWQR